MVIKPVSEILAPVGFQEPLLNALVPNENNYKVLLMQPCGQIEVNAEFVRNRDQILAGGQFGRFLQDAVESQADLVVTPEYSMPWNVLLTAIREGTAPIQGKLWALGCESIKYSEIAILKQDLAPFATVLYEPLIAEAARFVSPLVYVFKPLSLNCEREENTVVLIQFKTHPMGDTDHFEISGMQRGTCVYQFGANGHQIKLTSLICSDAFAFDDSHAQLIYDRALILHIQLNQEPRHIIFTGCRKRLLGFSGDETEVICLNWARDVHMWHNDTEVNWQNIAGSGWYLKSKQFDYRDSSLCPNHKRGLYYTYLKSLRTHTMFLNYDPATYLLEATKVAHIGVSGAISRRRGPQLRKVCKWDGVNDVWQEQEIADDGFLAVVGVSGDAQTEVKHIADTNPFNAERILALSAGKVELSVDWHKPATLDSCVIEESEVVRRLTFCQDNHPDAKAFRSSRLLRFKHLWRILHTEDLPPALMDLEGGFRFEWSLDYPHQNVISTTGRRATVMYMGEEADATEVEAIKKRIAEYLLRTASDVDQCISAQQRLAVWYREDERIMLFDPYRYVKIDQTGGFSEFDVGRES